MAEFVRSIRAPRQLIIEEGTLAGWIKEIMEARGERVVIRENPCHAKDIATILDPLLQRSVTGGYMLKISRNLFHTQPIISLKGQLLHI